MKKVLTTGVFDLLHEGHFRLLTKARELGDHLTVGVQDDVSVQRSKGRPPVLSENERQRQLQLLPFVDEVFAYAGSTRNHTDLRWCLDRVRPQVVVQGDDWIQGELDPSTARYAREKQIEIVLLPYTPSISSSEIKHRLIATARQFWENKASYPQFGNIKRRRLHELNYLIPRLQGNSLLDLGCGDGALLECLARLTDLRLIGYDLSGSLLKNISPRIETKVFDCLNPVELPATSNTVMAGVCQYLFDEEAFSRLLSRVNSPVLFLRSTCTLKDKNELVETFSERLQAPYCSMYYTVPYLHGLLSRHFVVEEVMRIYPDEIESEFGTKQFYFKCVKRRATDEPDSSGPFGQPDTAA